LPTRAWQPLIAVVIALGIPAVAAAEWHRLIARHPVVALVLATVWLVACGIVVGIRKALAEPAQRRLEQAGNAADRAAGWLLSGYGRRYRRWVLDSRRYIDVKDLSTGGDHTPELDDVYVDVALVGRAPHQVPASPLGNVPQDATGRHSISEFLDHADPVVLAVLGPPGCGKSTLLAHIARRTASAGHRKRRRIPVLLSLREQAPRIAAYSEQKLPEITRAAVSSMPDKEPDGWWEEQFRRGRCIILLDGLDEVARDEDRRVVAKWVERQINSYPGNDFVVTSRPHGFPGPVIAQANILAVRPFTPDQVSLFLNRWYLTTEKHATGASTDAQMRSVRIMAGRSADRLIALLRATPALYALTVNPLLLTMIAMVHRYRGALPGSRADLYSEICQVMLSRRTQAKDLPELLPGPAKHKLLTTLAYQMMVDHISELPAEQALEILDPLMERLPQDVTGQAFLDDVSHNGLLTEPATGRYAFAHLTFQEYLAARHASDNPSHAHTLTKAVDDQWWHESILLYAAIANADKIVRASLDKGTIHTLALAFDCAEGRGELAPDLRQRLREARDRAFTEDCDPQYRRLIAAVLAIRLSHEVTITTAGNRICTRPVPADLYWLFLKDTQAVEPDNPCQPDPATPALGMWNTEATVFTRWLNDVTAGASQVEFRLPAPDELELRQVAEEVIKQLPESVTGLWIRRTETTAAQLWVPAGHVHPHDITADTISQAVVADTGKTTILALISAATTLDTAVTIFQLLLYFRYLPKTANIVDTALSPILAVARDISHDLARDLDVSRDLARSLDSALEHALDRAYNLSEDLERALERDLQRANDLSRDVARALEHALAGGVELGVELGVERAHDRDRDLDLSRGLERALGIERAHAFARSLERALDRDLDRDLERALDRDLERALDLSRALERAYAWDSAHAHFPSFGSGGHRFARLAIQLLATPGVPLMWVTEGPLGAASRAASRATLAMSRAESPVTRAFAKQLTLLSGVSAKSTITAPLGEPLIESLRGISRRALPHYYEGDTASMVADTAAGLLAIHRQPTKSQAATIRVLALAIAASFAERDDSHTPDVFMTLAAMVTLLQRRADGAAPVGEGILLVIA
jgi:hypothetical protein